LIAGADFGSAPAVPKSSPAINVWPRWRLIQYAATTCFCSLRHAENKEPGACARQREHRRTQPTRSTSNPRQIHSDLDAVISRLGYQQCANPQSGSNRVDLSRAQPCRSLQISSGRSRCAPFHECEMQAGLHLAFVDNPEARRWNKSAAQCLAEVISDSSNDRKERRSQYLALCMRWITASLRVRFAPLLPDYSRRLERGRQQCREQSLTDL